MRVGIYDPYLETLGGGERYTLTLAEHLSKDHQVEIFWDGRDLKGDIKNRLALDSSRIRFMDNIFAREKSLLEKLLKTSQYDLIFYLSDGSIASTLAKKNILHFQTPFTRLDGETVLNRLKLSRFNQIVCNSYFTKKFIDKTYEVKSLVVYPPVDVSSFKVSRKKDLILTVGRFTSFFESKKQEIMIEIFKNMVDQGLKDWEFVLIGGMLDNDQSYFDRLTNQASNYPIKLLANIPFNELKKYYSEAKIYWHATGFGENEDSNPELFEHFGISCVEAMAAGAVPIVFNGGGLREIITTESGLLWRTKNELQDLTRQLIVDERKLVKFENGAANRAKEFSKEVFLRKFDEIIFS